MRPYLVLCAVVLMAAAALAQQPVPRSYGGYYGYGPYTPLISTPMISLETVSPNPVGASNATTGLIAGATNSTLSQIEGSTSSVYTVPVWYQGGAPLTTSDVHVWPEPLEGEHHEMHRMMHGALSGPMVEERERNRREEVRNWMYFSGAEHTAGVGSAASALGKGSIKGDHKYGNDDVTRQNEKTGMVHYDGKNEKIQ